MIFLSITIIVLLIALFIVFYFKYKKYFKISEGIRLKIYEEEKEKIKQKFNDKYQEYSKLDNLINEKFKNIDETLRQYYNSQLKLYQNELTSDQEKILTDVRLDLNEEISNYKNEIKQCEDVLNDFKNKQNAINEEIRQRKMIEENQDFYRICLKKEDLSDIQILKEIKNKLNKFELLNKLIYDNYVSKYVKEMEKRILKGQDISGIYKVTNLTTKEIYIGKSVNIADRWVNHIKGACGLEGIADSQFQRALKKYGIQNFSWEILEKVTKDQLSEREKYYIDLYDTKNYGYNQRLG